MKTRLVITSVVVIVTLLAMLVVLTTLYMTDARKADNNGPIIIELIPPESDPMPTPRNRTLAPTSAKLYLLENSMEYACSNSDQIGGHLGHISLHCESEKLSNMKTALGDIDQPLDTKMVALAVSSIAVGCTETALFVGRLLVGSSDMYTDNTTVIHGPNENASFPCDLREAESLKGIVNSTDRLRLLYDILSSSLFLTLGCRDSGLESFSYLVQDFNLTTAINQSNSDQNSTDKIFNGTDRYSNKNKGALIMRYVNQRKFDSSIDTVMNEWGDSIKRTKNGTTGHKTGRSKRNVANDDITRYYKVKVGCAIEFPLGITLFSLSKLECLQLCLDEASCQSVGYTNDASQICHLNTEIEKEVETFFVCGQDDFVHWDYFEKIADIDYFLISSKHTGKVLQAKSSFSVEMMSFNGNDNQLWFWEGDTIRSKKYNTKVLDLYYTGFWRNWLSLVHLNSYHGGTDQRWNYYENGSLTSQYKNLRLDVKYGNSNNGARVGGSLDNGAVHQKWTLSLDRVYFVITGRHSGKVLDASISGSSSARIQLWSYHGDDNQLWFWDDDTIRSKKFPDKVLQLDVIDYVLHNWGKVLLNKYNGWENQRWKMEGDNVISFYKDLRLDVKWSSKEEGAKIGGYPKTGNPNQMWSVGIFRAHFYILNKASGKVIDASSSSEIVQWPYNGGDNQLWFWDGDVIRSKKYTDKVIDLDGAEYERNGWGKIRLQAFRGADNQRWQNEDQYVISMYKNLSIEVKDRSHSDNSQIVGQGRKTQKWSFNQQHNLFTITSRQDAKVLDASLSRTGRIQMWSFHGDDNQLWFWDDNSIRSKKFPNKVLDLNMYDYGRNKWGKVDLYTYHGRDDQRWRIEGDSLISFYKDLRLNIKSGSRAEGAEVGGYIDSAKKLNQMWSVNPKERIHFTIRGVSGKALDAFKDKSGNIGLWSYNGDDNQLWFWDKDSFRSKQYPDKVLDLNMDDYEKNAWGRISLRTYDGGLNQLWSIRDESAIISHFKQLRMDVHNGKTSNGAMVGGYRQTGNDNQKWAIAARTDPDCIDETEEKIYAVVQWIPLIGTLWDLGSSIGYGAAGCTDVAQERAISFAIGFVMDAATVVTGGAAAGARVAVQTGIKAAFKLGAKEGLKVTFHVAKQSMKHFMKTVAKQGVRKTFNSGIKRLARETIIDPAMFLKNAGKMSRSILVHPKRTLQQSWEAVTKNIKHLDALKKQLKGINTPPNLRCRRAPLCNRGAYVKKMQRKISRRVLKGIPDGRQKISAQRYMVIRHRLPKGSPSRIKRIKDINKKMDKNLEKRLKKIKREEDRQALVNTNNLKQAKIWAAYDYTVQSGVNPFTRRSSGYSFDRPEADTYFNQAILVQTYLKDAPGPPRTVYRWEDRTALDMGLYEPGQIYTTEAFHSTKKSNARINDPWLDLSDTAEYPVEVTIRTKSGRDITGISNYPGQEEVLIPMGTQFRVIGNEKVGNVIKVTLEEI